VNIPEDLRYSPDHEWVRLDGGKATIGITDYAQDALGDVVYVDLPAVGAEVVTGESFGEVESTKSVSDLFSPTNGTILEVNTDLEDNPETVNSDPYGQGWIIVVELADAGEMDQLLDAEGYGNLIEE